MTNPLPTVPKFITSGPQSDRDWDVMNRWLARLRSSIIPVVSVDQFGARIDGTSDDTVPFQNALNQIESLGGGTLFIPGGTLSYSSVVTPKVPVWIQGDGITTVLASRKTAPPGQGIIDVQGSNFRISDLTMDGGTLFPVGLQYNRDFVTNMGANDPMAPSLTNNSAIWVHGNTENFFLRDVRFRHTTGYSVILDALNGDIRNPHLIRPWLEQIRPNWFGTTAGQLLFGAYTGGILAKGDGRASFGSQSGVVIGLLVEMLTALRVSGNCLWSHNYGFDRWHSQFRWIGGRFEDCGLDAMLPDVVDGITVEANVGRRIGYTTADDNTRSVPRWLVGLNATALDSGAVKNANYVGNSFMSVNGGMIDLDTHCMGTVGANICRIPYPDEPEYDEDQIALTGPANTGNQSYGINLGVNYPVAEGGRSINMSFNTLLNLPNGAARLYSAKGCLFAENIIDHPASAPSAPVRIGPQGALAYQQCYDNKVHHNHITYAPGSALPAIQEDDSIALFQAGQKNYVYGNAPIPGGGSAIEFAKAASSSSTVYAQTVWFP